MKIGIIDPVGIKAGMNCYDLGLLNAHAEKHAEPFSFSNFYDAHYKKVNQHNYFLPEKKNSIVHALNFCGAHFKALFKCRQLQINWVILHVFSTNPKDYFSFLICKIFKRSIIAIIHDIESLTDENNSVYRKAMYNMADILVVHNQTSLKMIEAQLDDKNRHKIRIIPHGNFIPFISKHTIAGFPKHELELRKDLKYILFFGQIKKVKGLDILLRAIPLLPPDVRLIIAGRPFRDDFKIYEDIINELDIADKVIPVIRFIKDEEKDFLFKRCNALILPYRKIFQSGVLLTAMSYELPVVASDLEANREIIDHGHNGFLFEDGNPNDLAEKIKMLFSSKDIESIQQEAYKTAATSFSWSFIADHYLNIIRNN